MTRASAAEAETARLRAALSEKTAECESRGRRLIEAEGEWSEELSALRAALSAVRAALESGKPPPAEIVAAVARSPAASGAPSPGTPPLATHAGAKRSDADAAAAAASEKKRRSRAEGMEHVSALSKELDTRARVFEDDADFIVEVREGSSDADLDPNFELKNLGLRFENWKRDFKDRLRETRLMLKRLDKLENGIGGDDAFDDAYAYGYREDDAYPSREDAYGDEVGGGERLRARRRAGPREGAEETQVGTQAGSGTEEMNCDGTIRIASRCDVQAAWSRVHLNARPSTARRQNPPRARARITRTRRWRT